MFTLERGILQGSVLSPVLFLLIMDPLLKSLQCKPLGPSIGDMYAGAFIQADGIYLGLLYKSNLITVQTFAVQNLTLNPTKCEVVLVSPSKPVESAPIAVLGGETLTPRLSAKCLGYWWSWDLSATKAVDEAIKKAFFAFGAMGVFHGQLNPISVRRCSHAAVWL
jgi:hypothetical protein